MKNGNLTDFLDKLYYGGELWFVYKSKEYFLQGWNESGESVMVMDIQNERALKDYVWKVKKKTMRECAEDFLEAKLWDGKNFWEIESEITWVD